MISVKSASILSSFPRHNYACTESTRRWGKTWEAPATTPTRTHTFEEQEKTFNSTFALHIAPCLFPPFQWRQVAVGEVEIKWRASASSSITKKHEPHQYATPNQSSALLPPSCPLALWLKRPTSKELRHDVHLKNTPPKQRAVPHSHSVHKRPINDDIIWWKSGGKLAWQRWHQSKTGMKEGNRERERERARAHLITTRNTLLPFADLYVFPAKHSSKISASSARW